VQIDVRLDEVVLRALEKNPDLRYQQVSEVKTMVETIVSRAGIPPAEPGIATPPPQKDAEKLMGDMKRLLTRQGMLSFAKRSLLWFTKQGLLLFDLTAKPSQLKFWPVLLLASSNIGFLVNGGVLAAGLAQRLWHAKPPALSMQERMMFEWMVLFAVGRLAALNLGADGVAEAGLGITKRRVVVVVLTLLGMAALASVVPLSSQWMDAVSPAALIGSARVARWVAIAFVVGLFLAVGLWFIRILVLVCRGVKHNTEASANAKGLPAVEDWLAIMDGGNYGQSWETAPAHFQRAISKEQWLGRLEKVRRPLGKVLSRRLSSTKFTAAGTRLVAKYETSFDGLLAAVETVALALQPNGEWKAIGYLIRPAAREKRGSYAASGIAAALVCAILILAVLFHLHAERNGQWQPQRLGASQAAVQNPLASLRVTGVERESNIVIFQIVSDPGFPAHLITAEFKGPRITNWPKSYQIEYSGPELSCLLGPAEVSLGWSDGTSFTGNYLDLWQRKVSPIGNKQHGPGEFFYGFYLPDEETSEMVVKQARTHYLGRTTLIGEAANVLLLFDLNRFAGKDAAGKEKWQQLTGTLNFAREFDVAFGPVLEQVLALDTNGQTDCFDLVSGKLVPLPKYALGGLLPARAKVPPSADLPSGVGIYRRDPYDAREGPSVYATGGTVLRYLSNEKWEDMSAAQVLTVAGTMQAHPGPGGLVGPSLPATFLFKTPTRTAGLLQVVGTNANPPSVNLRYKTVQYGSATKTNSAAAPAKPGTQQ
jgi:hypothetical protein